MQIVLTEVALLQALLQGEGYADQLIELMKKRTNGSVLLLQGRVHPVLRLLHKKRLVTLKRRDNPGLRGGRPRHVFALTSRGRIVACKHRKMAAKLFAFGTHSRRKR